jgi:hypothetical protein
MAIRRQKSRHSEEEEEAAQTFETPVFRAPTEGLTDLTTATDLDASIASEGDDRLETNKDLQFRDPIDGP